MKLVSICLFALLFSSCATLSFRDIGSLGKELGISRLPVQADYPGAHAVIIMNRTDVSTVVDTENNYTTTVTVRRVEKIFNDIRKESAMNIILQPGQTLLDIKARTIRPDGKIIPIRKKEFHVTYGGPFEGSVFHSDIGEVSFTFPGVVSGAIVEYAYRVVEKDPFSAGEWDLQQDIPVMRSIYSISVPSFLTGNTESEGKSWQWNYVVYDYPDAGPPAFDRHFSSSGKGPQWENTYTWELKDIPAFRAEPEMPPRDWYRGYVQFAPPSWQTWDDVSEWYYDDVLKTRLVTTDLLRKEAAQLAKGADTELDTLDRIYRFVQNIPYSENKQRLGELKPEFPEKVLKNNEGDSRGKAILLVSLLKAVGISAKPAVIVTRSNGRLDTSFPCWRFHRMIVGALISGDRIAWLDPAAQYCLPGEVPPQDEAAVALVMNADASYFLVSTPASQAWNNTIYMDVHAVEHLGAPADFNVVARYGGEAGVEMRNRFAENTDQMIHDYCETMVTNSFADAKLEKYAFTPLDSLGGYFTLSFDFTATNLVRQDSSEYALYVDPFPSMEDLGWIGGSERDYPVEFKYPYVLNKKISVDFSDSLLSLKNLPEGISIEVPDFDYSSAYSADNPLQIVLKEVFTSKSRLLQPDHYNESVNFFGEISKAKGEPVVLVRR